MQLKALKRSSNTNPTVFIFYSAAFSILLLNELEYVECFIVFCNLPRKFVEID